MKSSIVGVWTLKRLRRPGPVLKCALIILLVTAPMIAALIFVDGMIEGITEKFIYLSNGHVQLSEFSDLETARKAAEMDEVLFCDATLSSYCLLYSKTGTASLLVKAVEKDYFNDMRKGQLSLEMGEVAGGNTIILSKVTSEALGIGIGDRLAMMTVSSISGKDVIRPVLLKVAGLYSSGYEQLDTSLAYMSYDFAQGVFSSSPVLEILVTKGSTETVKRNLESLAAGLVTDYGDYNRSIYDNFITSKQAILIIFLLIAAVACVNTATVASEMINDDYRTIAAMKILGLDSRRIMLWAFCTVFPINMAGLACGLVLGILIAVNLGPFLHYLGRLGIQSLSFYLLDFKPLVSLSSILIVSAAIILVSAAAILIALRSVRKISPMQLFRQD